MKIYFKVFFVCVFSLITFVSYASNLGFDNFELPGVSTGSINGQGNIGGWSGAWVGTPGVQEVIDISSNPMTVTLSGGIVVDGGNQALEVIGSSNLVAAREFEATYSDSIFFGFLLRYDAGTIGSNDFVTLCLNSVAGCTFSNLPTIGLKANIGPGNTDIMVRNRATNGVYSPVQVNVGETNYVVGRAYKSTGNPADKYDRFDLWVNPDFTDPNTENNPDATDTDISDISTIHYLSIRSANISGGKKVSLDGIAMADNWNDINPATPPTIIFVDDIETGPVRSDDISIKVEDVDGDVSSYKYGFVDNTSDCNSGSTLSNSFSSETLFTLNTEDNNGKYICVKAVDNGGHASYTTSIGVLNIDITSPNITLSGSGAVYLETGDSYIDAGAICSDNIDTTCSVTSSGTVNTGIPGTYNIYYDAIDIAGNVAIQASRVIIVESPKILINEVEYDPTGTESEGEWIELYNPTNSVVSLSGWTLTEAGGSIYTFTGGVSIPALGYLVVGNDTAEFVLEYPGKTLDIDMQKTDSPTCFNDTDCLRLNNGGDVLILKDSIGSEIDHVEWESGSWSGLAGNNGHSICRTGIIDTDLPADWMSNCDSTPGGTNTIDTTAPIITLVGSGTIVLEIGDSYTDAGATWIDDVDGSGSLVAAGGPVITSSTGSFLLSYDYTDAAGNTATQITRTVNVLDTTAPVITLSGSGVVEVLKNKTYTDSGATATDNLDGNITNNIVIVNPVDTSNTGSYIVTYNLTDVSGNVASEVTRTVNVVTGDVPVITLNGSTPINIEVGSSYSDAGAIAYDTEDGSITANIVNSGSVNTSILGTYIINYNITDSSDNNADQVTRVVNVIDTTAPSSFSINVDISGGINTPVISFATTDNLGIDRYEVSINGSAFTTQTSPYSPTLTPASSHTIVVRAYDSSGNFTSATISYPPVVNINSPTILSHTGITDTTFQVLGPNNITTLQIDGSLSNGFTCAGELVPINTLYTFSSPKTSPVTCSGGVISATTALNITAGDGFTIGNSSQGYVVDKLAPVITLMGSGTIYHPFGVSYTDAGATCSDNHDTSCSVSSSGSVDINNLGTYTISYSAGDTVGNIATQVTRTVNVIDTTPPVISLNGSSNITINKNDTYTDLGAEWTDNVDGIGSLVASGSVDTSSIGSYVLTYNYTDTSGNIGTQISRTINIVSGSIPTITLNGSGSIDIEVGTSYSDLGAQFSDVEDGTGSVIGSGSVDINTLGNYTIRYDYTDSSGNSATQVTRTINVIDTTSPLINFSPVIENTTILLGENYTLPSSSCTDNYDATCTVSYIGTVNRNVIGAYPVIYSASDNSGNTVSKTFTVNVQKHPSASGGDPKYDRCNGNDTSGSIYDGKCSKEENNKETTQIKSEEKDVKEEQEEISVEEKIEEQFQMPDGKTPVQDNTKSYTLKNNFQNCDIVNYIQDPEYKSSKQISFIDNNAIKDVSLVEKFVNLGVVNGYEDGYFLPGKEISRVEFLKFVLKSHCYEYKDQDTSSIVYTDVDKNTWQAKVISKADSLGMIHGDMKENSILLIPSFSGYIGDWSSSSEIKKLKNILQQTGLYNGDINGEYSEDLFDAVYKFQLSGNLIENKDDTGAGYWGIKTQKKFRDIYSKDENGIKVFRPNDVISKIEALKILLRVSEIQSQEEASVKYKDVNEIWYKKYVENAQALNLYNATEDNYFFIPESGVKREEMLYFISRLIKLYK